MIHLIENSLLNGEVIRLDAAARMGPSGPPAAGPSPIPATRILANRVSCIRGANPSVLYAILRYTLPLVLEDTLAAVARKSNGAVFTRGEPVVVAAFVAHAGWVWAANDTGVWEWSLAGILVVLGALAVTGFFQRDAQLALIRAGLAVGTLVLVGEQSGAPRP